MTNFDILTDRTHTNSVKWDRLIDKYGENNDIIPMGVADMDFVVAQEIRDAFIEKVGQKIFGYENDPLNDAGDAILNRYNTRGYDIKREDIIMTTGVVYAINMTIKALSKPGDKIVLPAPYYTPFEQLICENDREILECPMIIRNNRYELDLAAIEDKVDEKTTMMIFCNPHNPTGRIYDDTELNEVADFAQRHNLIILSDEIHADFALTKPFKTIMNISEYTKNNTVVFLSATKTFNLAGIKASFCFIKNPEFRDKFNKITHHTGVVSVNSFGVVAVKAAYEKAGKWEKDLVDYLRENCRFALEYINNNIPEIKVLPNEGTYLLWLDMRDCGIDYKTMNEYLITEAKVQLNDGEHYGKDFAGYQRMNCALPRYLLEEALKRIEKVVHK